jgi:hypothetical protein
MEVLEVQDKTCQLYLEILWGMELTQQQSVEDLTKCRPVEGEQKMLRI